jgi:hypothetical protein
MSDRYELKRRASLRLVPVEADEPRVISLLEHRNRRARAEWQRRAAQCPWADLVQAGIDDSDAERLRQIREARDALADQRAMQQSLERAEAEHRTAERSIKREQWFLIGYLICIAIVLCFGIRACV